MKIHSGKFIKIRQNDGCHLELDIKNTFFLFENIFIAFLDTENVGLAIKFRSLKQLQVEKLANVILLILKNRQNDRSIPGYQVLTS